MRPQFEQFRDACMRGDSDTVASLAGREDAGSLNKGLLYACQAGHEDICRVLINHGASVDAFNNAPLAFAAQNGHREVCLALVDQGASPNEPAGKPMIWAALANRTRMLECLFELGGNPEILPEELYIACAQNGLDSIMKLIDSKTSRFLRMEIGQKAFLAATTHRRPAVLAYTCQKHHLTPDLSNYFALKKAVDNEWPDVVQVLLDNGASPDFDLREIHDETGKETSITAHYPLRRTIQHGSADILDMLADAGANIHFDEDFLLCEAARVGNLPILKALVQRGADINAGNGTPLSGATKGEHLDCIRYLLEKGADRNLVPASLIRASTKEIRSLLRKKNPGRP